MKTFLKMLAAIVAAIGLGIVLMAYDASDRAVIATTFAAAILLSLVLGVFDVKERKDVKQTSIKDATRNYGQAAIIVGGACLFMGEPKECEELCDELWHRGVQAEVLEEPTEEVFNVL
jgi:FtsH-binding integral membrane protein